MKKKKKFIFILCLAGALYFLLSYHIIIVDHSFKLLKKSELTLEYTFFFVKGRTNKAIMKIDALREDGIGEILVDLGRMTEEERDGFLAVYGEEES